MALTQQELRDSGLLELYVLGAVEGQDLEAVELGLRQYPALRDELRDIEKALHYYASAHGIPAPPGTLDKVLKEINAGPHATTNKIIRVEETGGMSWLKWVLGLATIGLLILTYFQAERFNQLSEEHKLLKEDCQSQEAERQKQNGLFASLANANNNIVEVAATEKYPTTKLLLYDNPVEKKNFIQIQNLPPITADQSYQLWSLKGDNPPMPLDVFQNDSGFAIEVQHIDETNAYAITIEPLGGSQSPNLDDLIGVFSL